MEIIIFIGILLTLGLISRAKKHIPPERTKQQKEDDELITVILPTINDKK